MRMRVWLGSFVFLGISCWWLQSLTAQDDFSFDEEPAKVVEDAADTEKAAADSEAKGDEKAGDEGDDLFGGDDDKAADEKATDEQPKDDDIAKDEEADAAHADDDLFGGDDDKAAEDDNQGEIKEKADAKDEFDFGDKPEEKELAEREARPRDEVKASLVALNDSVGKHFAVFVERNKQLAKAAVQNGQAEELMTILREYGPAVIATKQAWLTLVGNPAKYDTWIGSAEYTAAWRTLSTRWQVLQQYPKRFAAVDIDLANKLTDELAKLGDSFQEYSDLSDEWDGKMGNERRSFAFAGDKEPDDDAINFGNNAELPEKEADVPAGVDEDEEEAIEKDEVKEDADDELPADKGAKATLDQDDTFDLDGDADEKTADDAEKAEDDDLFGDSDDAKEDEDADEKSEVDGKDSDGDEDAPEAGK